MKRMLVFLAALVALGGAIYGVSRVQADNAPAATAAPRTGGRVAVFNVMKVMRDYKRWQHFAGVMNNKRASANGAMGKLRAEILEMQNKIQDPRTTATEKEQLTKSAVEKQRQFEDQERVVRKQLEDETSAYLKNLYGEIQQCVKAVAESNGFDVVFCHMDALTKEDMESPAYFEMKLRPMGGAIPFHVANGNDVTDVLVQTLNQYFKPPVEQTGASVPAPSTAPAAPPR